MKKTKIIGIIVLVVAIAFIGVLLFMKMEADKVQNNQSVSQEQKESATENPAEIPTEIPAENIQLVSGRYVVYDAEKIDDEGYNDTILFFHAGWCTECRAFEKEIENSELPKGVQILKVDYDTATELRQKYGVTLQSSFVSVDSNGDKITYWQGYGKDKSVDAILENT